MRRLRNGAGMPSALMTTASTGFSPSDASHARAIASATASAVALTAGTKRTITASMPRVGEQERQNALVRVCRMPSRACRRDWRGSPPPAAAARSLERVSSLELRQLEPGRLAGIRAQDPEAAGVRQHGDAPSARHRLRREQRRDVDELLQGARADDAGLMEERVDGRLRAGQRRGVRARRARRRQLVVPLLTARIGFVRATRRASVPNRRGLPKDSR